MIPSHLLSDLLDTLNSTSTFISDVKHEPSDAINTKPAPLIPTASSGLQKTVSPEKNTGMLGSHKGNSNDDGEKVTTQAVSPEKNAGLLGSHKLHSNDDGEKVTAQVVSPEKNTGMLVSYKVHSNDNSEKVTSLSKIDDKSDAKLYVKKDEKVVIKQIKKECLRSYEENCEKGLTEELKFLDKNMKSENVKTEFESSKDTALFDLSSISDDCWNITSHTPPANVVTTQEMCSNEVKFNGLHQNHLEEVPRTSEIASTINPATATDDAHNSVNVTDVYPQNLTSNMANPLLNCNSSSDLLGKGFPTECSSSNNEMLQKIMRGPSIAANEENGHLIPEVECPNSDKKIKEEGALQSLDVSSKDGLISTGSTVTNEVNLEGDIGEEQKLTVNKFPLRLVSAGKNDVANRAMNLEKSEVTTATVQSHHDDGHSNFIKQSVIESSNCNRNENDLSVSNNLQIANILPSVSTTQPVNGALTRCNAESNQANEIIPEQTHSLLAGVTPNVLTPYVSIRNMLDNQNALDKTLKCTGVLDKHPISSGPCANSDGKENTPVVSNVGDNSELPELNETKSRSISSDNPNISHIPGGCNDFSFKDTDMTLFETNSDADFELGFNPVFEGESQCSLLNDEIAEKSNEGKLCLSNDSSETTLQKTSTLLPASDNGDYSTNVGMEMPSLAVSPINVSIHRKSQSNISNPVLVGNSVLVSNPRRSSRVRVPKKLFKL